VQAVLSAIARGRIAIDAHPLYAWMADAETPLGRRFVFAPLFANFILGFSDLNRWFLRYPEPRNGYEAAINAHTEEDETHSALFLEDWQELGLDAQLGWGVEDTMAWYYTAPETEVFRRYAMRLTRMCVETPDPLVRFGLMEAVETCGHVFFGHTAPLAEELSRRTGAALRYFGPYHLARETGTLIDAGDLFEAVVLTPEQRRQAIALVDEVFAMFTVKNDHLLAYAKAVTAGAAVPRPAQAARPAVALGGEVRPLHTVEQSSEGPMGERLAARKAELAAHPFLAWLSTPTADPVARLRAYVPLWIPDIMGYADLMTYALAYPAPGDAAERALNRHAARLACHHRLFLADAAALDLDGALGWGAGETLHFLGHSPATELQRGSVAAFVDIAFRHRSPVVRYWLMEALQASGEAFFHHGSVLAQAVERRLDRPLHYLADRHRLAHPALEPDAAADAVRLARLPASAAEQRAALAGIDTVFDRLAAQMDQSLREMDVTRTAS
jgi:hypothetical protein